MDIVIGSIPPLPAQNQKPQQWQSQPIEGQVLHARAPRKGISGPSGKERRSRTVKDPVKGKVLTIMVPDAGLLPPDIDTADYEVTLRLVRK